VAIAVRWERCYDFAMRTTRYLLICLVLVVLGLVSLGEGVTKGEAGMDMGNSLTSISVRFCGTSTGGWAAVGILAVLGGAVFFAIALIASTRRRAL
jgi:hypothetical protein